MRWITESRRFGIDLAFESGNLFRLRLLLDGEAVGDYERAIVWSDLRSLARMGNVEPVALDPSVLSPAEIMAAINEDDDFHDACLPGLCETFDRWLMFAYVFEGEVVFVFGQDEAPHSSWTRTVCVPRGEYNRVVASAIAYHERFSD